MSKETIAFRIEREKREKLDKIAENFDRDRSYILNEAIDNYLDVYAWQIEEINQALIEAEAEDFASEAEIEATFERLADAQN